MVRKVLSTICLLCAAAAIAACAGPSALYRANINAQIASGNLSGALEQVEASKNKEYSRKDALLYYLDRGALLYDLSLYKESDADFAEAESIMDELFTRSISRGIGTVLINDNTTEYGGEIFERALMHSYRAMNFLFTGLQDEALVEARKVTAFLARYSSYMQGKSGYRDSPFAQYLSAMLFEQAGQNDDARIAYNAAYQAASGNFSYLQVPLGNYNSLPNASKQNGSMASSSKNGLRGRRRASYNSLNNSFNEISEELSKISANKPKDSEKAKEIFDKVSSSAEQIEQSAVQANLPDKELQTSADKKNFAETSSSNLFDVPAYKDLHRQNLGEIVLIHYNGPSPMKVSRTMQVAWNNAVAAVEASGERDAAYENAIRAGFIGRAITVAYPEYIQQPYSIVGSQVESENSKSSTRLIEDISLAARITLQMKNTAIWARAVARATIKYVLAKAVSKAGSDAIQKNVEGTAGQLLGMLFSAATHATAAATEIADTRGWTTMPAQIRLARMTEVPGMHKVTVSFLNGAGGIVGQHIFENVEVKKGQRTYLHCRTAM